MYALRKTTYLILINTTELSHKSSVGVLPADGGHGRDECVVRRHTEREEAEASDAKVAEGRAWVNGGDVETPHGDGLFILMHLHAQCSFVSFVDDI
jgi:hypothetical protein